MDKMHNFDVKRFSETFSEQDLTCEYRIINTF